MQSISKFNKVFRFLLFVIDIYSKNLWVIPLKGKKEITITYAFQKIIDESNPKPNKIWADEGSKCCHRSMKSFLQNNSIKIYSTNNECKYVNAKRFTKTLKIKIINTYFSFKKCVY